MVILLPVNLSNELGMMNYELVSHEWTSAQIWQNNKLFLWFLPNFVLIVEGRKYREEKSSRYDGKSPSSLYPLLSTMVVALPH